MKKLLLLTILVGVIPPAWASDIGLPAPFPAERYEVMIAKSPFALATAPAPVAAAPDKSFADGWYVTSLARLDGKDFVTIKSRDLAVQLSLFGEETKDGVTLEKVDWSPSIGRSTVIIGKDGQTAKLEFNQAELQSNAGAPPAPAPVGRPAMPGGANPNAARSAVPRPPQPVVQGLQNTGRANVPPVVQPQQFNPLPNGVPKPAGAVAPAGENRRRIRVINNVPAPGQ